MLFKEKRCGKEYIAIVINDKYFSQFLAHRLEARDGTFRNTVAPEGKNPRLCHREGSKTCEICRFPDQIGLGVRFRTLNVMNTNIFAKGRPISHAFSVDLAGLLIAR